MSKRKMSKEIKRLNKVVDEIQVNLGDLIDVVGEQTKMIAKMNGLEIGLNDLDAELKLLK